MRSRKASAVAAFTALVLLTACGSDKKTTSTTATPQGSGVTTPDVTSDAGPTPTVPPEFTVVPGGTISPDLTIPQSVVDTIISQLEQSGVKVDRACFEDLLKDEQLRQLLLSGNAPSSDLIQRLTACIQP
jgi:hypothetical protein